MAVTVNNGTQTPVVGAETTIATIAGGPFDNVSVYFTGGTGGGGGAIGVNVYATVAGVVSRVGAAQVQGGNIGTLVEFLDTSNGATGTTSESTNQNTSFIIAAGATTYTVKVIDLSTQPIPPGGGARQPCTVTLAGVNSSDTAADAPVTNAGTLAAGATLTCATQAGYNVQMDVAVSQFAPLPATVTVTANCGGGSVSAIVKTQQYTGTGGAGLVAMFRNLHLPVAVNYIVTLTNNGTASGAWAITSITYTGASAGGGGGAIPLNGDVIGPSNANIDVGWNTVPLLTAGANSFALAQLSDAGIPIFDSGLGQWRSFPLSGGATMNNAGVVTIAAGGLTLTGNTNGLANANTLEYFVTSSTDTDVIIAALPAPTMKGAHYVGMNGLTADRTVFLNTTGTGAVGDITVVKDEDGSLAAHNIIVDAGAGNTIDGAQTYTMTAVQNGLKGSITAVRISATAWAII